MAQGAAAAAPALAGENREYAQHVEKRFACGGAGINRLFGRLQGDPLGLELVHDVLKILQRTCQTVNASNNERVAGAQEFEQRLQLGTAVAA